MLNKIKITDLTVYEIRFPASHSHDESTARNPDPGYSALYVTLYTNEPKLKGYGLTFTISHAKEPCIAVIESLKQFMVGQELSNIAMHMGQFWQNIKEEGLLVSANPDAIHLSTSVVVNAVWDLWARRDNKPLWRLIVDMSPEEFVHCLDLNAITDSFTPEEALTLLRKNAVTRGERIADLLAKGYPAYNTSTRLLDYIGTRRLGSVNEILTVLLKAAKFNITIYPHASGVGLCEYVQHLAMVDYIYISGSLENRVLEYVDYLHEYFTAPAIIRDGHYQVPTAPGYSIKIKENSLLGGYAK